MMNELLVQIAKGLVSDPDAVNVTVDDIDEDGVTVYHLHVAADDMGRQAGQNCQGYPHGHALGG